MEWSLSHFFFSLYSLKGDEIKSTNNEREPVVNMLLFLNKEIRGASMLTYFQTSYLKWQYCSHMTKNNFTKWYFTKFYKIRDKFQNNLLPSEMNVSRISAVTKDSCQKALKWKNIFLFLAYYFLLSYMSLLLNWSWICIHRLNSVPSV